MNKTDCNRPRCSARPRLNRRQKLRLYQLHDLEYTATELADAIGCHVDTVYRGFVAAGCPHQRDHRNRILINGTELIRWFKRNAPQRRILLPDEAWCVRCNAPVTMAPPFTVKPTNCYLELVSAKCPVCHATINRARARENNEEDTHDQPSELA